MTRALNIVAILLVGFLLAGSDTLLAQDLEAQIAEGARGYGEWAGPPEDLTGRVPPCETRIAFDCRCK